MGPTRERMDTDEPEKRSNMIEALKSTDLVNKLGGKFKLTVLIQKRLVELTQGARPFIERKPGQTDMELAIQEILEEKIGIDYEGCHISKPEDIETATLR